MSVSGKTTRTTYDIGMLYSFDCVQDESTKKATSYDILAICQWILPHF
jgi:hypothetical protein